MTFSYHVVALVMSLISNRRASICPDKETNKDVYDEFVLVYHSEVSDCDNK